MAQRPANRIGALRRAKGLSQQQLAELVDAHWVTISKLERGIMQLTGGWIDRLAEALQVHPRDIRYEVPRVREVEIVGSILEDGSFSQEFDEAHFIAIETNDNEDIGTWWAWVQGDVLYPFCIDGDLVRFVNVDEEEIHGYIDRLCLVTLQDDQEILGFLETGAIAGQYVVRALRGRRQSISQPKRLYVAAEFRLQMPWHKQKI